MADTRATEARRQAGLLHEWFRENGVSEGTRSAAMSILAGRYYGERAVDEEHLADGINRHFKLMRGVAVATLRARLARGRRQ